MSHTLADFTCPHCGWNWADYAATGQFRCSGCLTAAFGPSISPSLLSDDATPTSKSDLSRGTPLRLLADLRIGIHLAVKDENYELAAILRDVLHFLRQRLSTRPPGA